MKIEFTGSHSIAGRDIEVYVFDTDLKLMSHEVDGTTELGLYHLLEEHQDNTDWPYTITNVCVRYRKKVAKGEKPKMEKIFVPINGVEYVYNKWHFNMWMFQIIGPDNRKLVIRFWNKNGNLEVASFHDQNDVVEDFINAAIYGDEEDNEPAEEPIVEMPDEYERYQQSADEVADDDWQQGSPYLQNQPLPNTTEHGIVQSNPYPNVTAPQPQVTPEGGGLIALGIISTIAFAAQAVIAYMVTHGIAIAGIFGIVAILTLIATIVAIVKHGKSKKEPNVKFGFPKAIIGIAIALLVIEVIAIIAILVLRFTNNLPSQLAFLYDLL